MRKDMKKRRLELEKSQEEVAENAGISRSHYTNIERGKKDPSFEVAMNIKKALRTESDDIFLNYNVPKGNKKSA